jgi:hypothetical protein
MVSIPRNTRMQGPGRHRAALDQHIADHIALPIDIGADAMRDLQRKQAETNAPVKTSRAEPVIIADAPETNMMPLVSAFARIEFEGEILGAILDIERADRRLRIAAPEEHAHADLHPRPERHRVGTRPAGARKGARDRVLTTDQPQVHRIAGNILCGVGKDLVAAGHQPVFVMAPQTRQAGISEREPQSGHEQKDERRNGRPVAGLERFHAREVTYPRPMAQGISNARYA